MLGALYGERRLSATVYAPPNCAMNVSAACTGVSAQSFLERIMHSTSSMSWFGRVSLGGGLAFLLPSWCWWCIHSMRQAGQRLGRVFAGLVSNPVRRRGGDGGVWSEPESRRAGQRHERGAGHAGRFGDGALWPVSRQEPVCRHADRADGDAGSHHRLSMLLLFVSMQQWLGFPEERGC